MIDEENEISEEEASTTMVQGIRHLPPRRSELYDLGDFGYVLGKKIGEGTYARVHKAYYYESKRGVRLQLACKIFDIKDAPKMFCKSFFPRELSIISSLKHKHVVGVHSILLRATKFFVFMKYGENGDLLAFIRKKGSMRESHAKIWYGQIISALQYMHGRNIVHRDLKCENIIITSRYNLKVGDFGFATIIQENESSRTFCGSLAYASPEITRGIPYKPRLADCWSSGIILFIMLNATMPFNERNINKLIASQMAKSYSQKYRQLERLSSDVIILIDKILEPDTEKRYTIDDIINSHWMKDINIALCPYESGISLTVQEYFKKKIEAIPMDDKQEEKFNPSINKPLFDFGNTKLDDSSKSYLQKLIDELSKPKNEIQDWPVIKDEKIINKIMELQKLHQKLEEKNKSRIQFTTDNRLGAMLPTKIEEPKRKVEKKIGEKGDRKKCVKEKDKKKGVKGKDRKKIDKEDLRTETVEEKAEEKLSALQILKKRFHNKQCGTENLEKSKDKKICGSAGGRKVSWCGLTTRPLKLTPIVRKDEEEKRLYHLKSINERNRKTDVGYEDGDKKTLPVQETTSAPKQPQQDERGEQRHTSIKPQQKADNPWQKIMKKIKRKK